MGAAAMTHLGGNNSPSLLNNVGKKTKKHEAMFEDAIKTFPVLKSSEGGDYDIRDGYVAFGYEPAYQFEDLEIICIAKDKEDSHIQTGHAFGYYGSRIRSTIKLYKDFKRKSRFTLFVDKWHSSLFPAKNLPQ
jgi:hypothetical protein